MIVDGKQLAQEIIEGLKLEFNKITGKTRLAVVLVGQDPASLSFIKQKQKIAQTLGIEFKLYQYPEDIKVKDLRKKVGEICKVTANKGVVVQLPLPSHINNQVILNAILKEKDVDVLCEKNLGAYYLNRLNVLPPVVSVIAYIIKKYEVDVSGKNVLIIGRGNLVGKPASMYFINQGATVISTNKHTSDLESFIKKADIIVSGAGQPDLIKGDMVKDGVVIFDAAVVEESGKLTGDCDFESVSKKASLITPVPGGIGPMTVAMLYMNLLILIKR